MQIAHIHGSVHKLIRYCLHVLAPIGIAIYERFTVGVYSFKSDYFIPAVNVQTDGGIYIKIYGAAGHKLYAKHRCQSGNNACGRCHQGFKAFFIAFGRKAFDFGGHFHHVFHGLPNFVAHIGDL